MKRKMLSLAVVLSILCSVVFTVGLFDASGATIEGEPITLQTGGFENFPSDFINAQSGDVELYSPLKYVDGAFSQAYYDMFASHTANSYIDIVSAEKYSGSKSLRLKYEKGMVVGSDYSEPDYTRFIFHEKVPAASLEDGTKYIFSAYIKTDIEIQSATAEDGVSLVIHNADSAGVPSTQATAITGTTGWQKVSLTFTYTTAAYGNDPLKIYVDIRNFRGSVWIDDMKLSKAVETAETICGGFEDFQNDQLNANTYGVVQIFSPLMYDPGGSLFNKFAGNSTTDYLYIDYDEHYQGEKSLKMNYPKGSVVDSVGTVNYTRFVFSEQIPVSTMVQGEKYVFSAYIKTDNVEVKGGAAEDGVSLIVYNADGAGPRSQPIKGTTGWQKVSVPFTYDSSKLSSSYPGSFVLFVDARDFSGTIWVDNMELYKETPGYTDGGFEAANGTVTDADPGWWVYTGHNGGNKAGIVSADNTVKYLGSQSLKIEHTAGTVSTSLTAGVGTSVWQNLKAFKAGKTYCISGKFKTQDVTPVSSWEGNADVGAHIRVTLQPSGTTIIIRGPGDISLRGDNDWITLSQEIVMPAGITTVAAGPALSVATGIVWADDFKVEEVLGVESTVISTLEGARVRLSAPAGLRFDTKILKTNVDDLVANENVKKVEYGTVIAPIDYITGEFTMDALMAAGKTFLDIKQMTWGKMPENNGGYYQMAASIVNINDFNYERSFSARAYVKVTMNNEQVQYIYSDYNSADNSRTVQFVAQEALNDASPGDYNPTEQGILENFADGYTD